MKIAICGAYGKMGKFMMYSLNEYHECIPIGRKDDLSLIINDIDLVIDFTNKEVAYKHFLCCLESKKSILIGTTGFIENELEHIRNLSEEARISCAMMPNYSLGILFLVASLSFLTKNYNSVIIEEVYPETKLDRPSGTTQCLKEMILEYNPMMNITISCLREKNCDVTHRFHFENEFEKIYFEHAVYDRRSYLAGVLKTIESMFEKPQWLDWKTFQIKKD